MRLLYVSEDIPDRSPGAGNGSSMIPFELLRSLPRRVVVHLVAFGTGTGTGTVPDEVRARCSSVELLPRRATVPTAVRWVMTGEAQGAAARRTRLAAHRLRELSACADVTLLHGPHVAWAAQHIAGPCVLQVVDPWSLRMAMERQLADGLRAWHRGREERVARRSEQALPDRTRLLTISACDAAAWSATLGGRPVRAVANGSSHVPSGWRRPNGPPTVCFTGSLDFGPNEHAAIRLVEEVAPRVWTCEPATRFVLAGRRPSPRVQQLAGPRVQVLADVPDMGAVLRAAHVAVFPDVHGVGVRNAVGEALATGVPVVATSTAARGHPQDRIVLRDDAKGLAAGAVDALRGAAAPTAAPSARSWAAACEEYLEELALAMRGNGEGQDR